MVSAPRSAVCAYGSLSCNLNGQVARGRLPIDVAYNDGAVISHLCRCGDLPGLLASGSRRISLHEQSTLPDIETLRTDRDALLVCPAGMPPARDDRLEPVVTVGGGDHGVNVAGRLQKGGVGEEHREPLVKGVKVARAFHAEGRSTEGEPADELDFGKPRVEIARLVKRSAEVVGLGIGLEISDAHREVGVSGEDPTRYVDGAATANVQVDDELVRRGRAERGGLGEVGRIQETWPTGPQIVELAAETELFRLLLHRGDLLDKARVVLLVAELDEAKTIRCWVAVGDAAAAAHRTGRSPTVLYELGELGG
mmetsp:Transcript_15915/g.48311  ORF Transcript_15915/g.48311 Transcript_15915/m.48311 type:complete len:310 (-) Transcript_15915:1029-1958(-)|eukprot:scaffold180141_cov24-Tisochrysis_lutea.AAC.1